MRACEPGRPCSCSVFDRALGLLLEHEEGLLGEIVTECQELVALAEEQALEMAEYLDQEA